MKLFMFTVVFAIIVVSSAYAYGCGLANKPATKKQIAELDAFAK